MKSKLIIFILAVAATTISLYAQKQNYQWRFGRVGIDFNNSPPRNVTGAALSTSEGSASVAERSTGALLFYTDGVSVWNAQNQVMPNGTGLMGGTAALLSSTTAAVILPKPGSGNLYYVITIDEGATSANSSGVRYNVVDMTLNGGSGDVVTGQKNIFLFQTNSEKLEVVPHANGVDFWVISHDFNIFSSFLLTASGFQSNPVVSTVGGNFSNTAGHLKVNRQFDKLACGSLFESKMRLFSFNNTTGVISDLISWTLDPVMLSFSPLIYGVEFSPNGELLYVSNLNTVIQYDITQATAAAIQNSAYLLAAANFNSPATLQTGPDRKIYINSGAVDVIHCPDNKGSACGYQAGVLVGGGYGLPKWVYSPDDTIVSVANTIVYSDSCFGVETRLAIRDTSGVTNVSWLFGDPNSGVNNTATGFLVGHSFSQTGTFNVRAILSGVCGSDTLYLAPLDIINCDTTCSGAIYTVSDICAQSAVPFSITSNGTVLSAVWSFDDPNSGTDNFSNLLNPVHVFNDTGTYTIRAIVTYSCGVDTIFKSLTIVNCEVPRFVEIVTSADSCLQSTVSFAINTNLLVEDLIEWNFGDPGSGVNNTSSLSAPTHQFSEEGVYTVRCILQINCSKPPDLNNPITTPCFYYDTIEVSISIVSCDSVETACNIYLPNAFTPNADLINDTFGPITPCAYEDYEMLVFNRWGEIVFRTTDPGVRWDGKFRGEFCPLGVYAYLVKYKEPMKPISQMVGQISLLR